MKNIKRFRSCVIPLTILSLGLGCCGDQQGNDVIRAPGCARFDDDMPDFSSCQAAELCLLLDKDMSTWSEDAQLLGDNVRWEKRVVKWIAASEALIAKLDSESGQNQALEEARLLNRQVKPLKFFPTPDGRKGHLEVCITKLELIARLLSDMA